MQTPSGILTLPWLEGCAQLSSSQNAGRLTTKTTDGTWSPLLDTDVAKLLATIIYRVKKWQSKEIRR